MLIAKTNRGIIKLVSRLNNNFQLGLLLNSKQVHWNKNIRAKHSNSTAQLLGFIWGGVSDLREFWIAL